MKPNLLACLTALLASAACHSEGANSPESSSSSHWFTCRTLAACSSAPEAVACTKGYCVDGAGARIPLPRSTSDAASERRAEDGAAGAAEDDVHEAAAGGARDAAAVEAPTPDARVDPTPTQTIEAGLSDDAGASNVKRLRVSANAYAQNSSVIPVALHDAQGALLAELYTTGADGTLETDLAASSVSLDRLYDDGRGVVLTYFGVEAGDNLITFGSSPQFGPAPPNAYSATVPRPQRGNGMVLVRGGCGNCGVEGSGSGSDTITVTDPRHCLRDQGDNALVAWADGATRLADFEGFTWRKGLAKPLAPAVQSIIFMTYQPASPCTVRMSDMLPGFSVKSALIMWSGATCVGVPELGDVHPYAPDFAEDLEAYAAPDGHLLRRRVAPAATIEFDRTTLLPTPGAPQVTILDNPTRIHVSWSMPQSARLDAASLELHFNWRTWIIVMPPDIRSVTLPPLPPDFSIPDSELPSAKVYQLGYLASDSVDGYAALRNAPPDYGGSILDRPLTTRGSADVSLWTNPQ
jgi:hypothetical protein